MRNKRYQSKENRGNTFISYNDTTDKSQYTSTPNNTISTTDDDEGMEIRLFRPQQGRVDNECFCHREKQRYITYT